jgi:hypothetical protein
MIQTLSENDIPPTPIAQLSGHKNLKSIENYSKVSTKQGMQMSKLLMELYLLLQPRHPPMMKEKIRPQFAHPTPSHNKPWLYSAGLL